MKNWLRAKTFSSNNQVIAETNEYFEEFDQTYFLEGIKKFGFRWSKYIELKEDYHPKNTSFLFLLQHLNNIKSPSIIFTKQLLRSNYKFVCILLIFHCHITRILKYVCIFNIL